MAIQGGTTLTTHGQSSVSIGSGALAITDPAKASSDPSAQASSSLSGRAVMDWTHWIMIGGAIGGFAGAAGSAMISNTIGSVAFGALGLISVIGFTIAQRAAEAIQLEDSINHLKQHQAVLISQTKKMEAAEKSINHENEGLFHQISDLTGKMEKLKQDREHLGQAYGNLQKASAEVNKTNTAFGQNLEKFPRLLHDLKRHVDSSQVHIKECKEVAGMFSGHVERLNGFAEQSHDLLEKARKVVGPFTTDNISQSQLVVLNQVTEISASICGLLADEKAQTKETLSSCSQQCDKMDTSVRSMDEMRGQLQTISDGLSAKMGKMDHRSSEAAKEHLGLNALIARLSEVCENLNRARIALQEKMSASGVDNQRAWASIGDAAADADRALNAKARDLKELESNLDRREKALAGREIVIQTQNNLFVNWCVPIVDFFLSLRLFGWVR